MFSESHLSSIYGTKMKKLLLAIFIILPLGGCTVHGNKSLTDENHQTVKLKNRQGENYPTRNSCCLWRASDTRYE